MVLLPEWDCAVCTPLQMDQRGCSKDATGRLIFLGEKMTRCPRRPVLDNGPLYSELFYLYGTYKNGMLPEGNALNENPHKLVQLLRLLGDGLASAEREAVEDTKRTRARRERYAAMMSSSNNR